MPSDDTDFVARNNTMCGLATISVAYLRDVAPVHGAFSDPVHKQSAHATDRNQEDNELRQSRNLSCHGSTVIPKSAALMARTNLITRLTWTKLRHHYNADAKQ